MNNQKLSARQIFALIVLFILGGAGTMGTNGMSRDAWLLTPLGGLVSVPLVALYIWVAKKSGDEPLSCIEKAIGSKLS